MFLLFLKKKKKLFISIQFLKVTFHIQAFPGAQSVKSLPAMLETWVQSLVQEDPLEKGMTTHASILAWRIPWTEEPGVVQSMGSQRVRHDWVMNSFTSIYSYYIGYIPSAVQSILKSILYLIVWGGSIGMGQWEESILIGKLLKHSSGASFLI